MNLTKSFLFAAVFVTALGACANSTDDPYSLNFTSAAHHIDFSGNTYSSAKKIVIQTKGSSELAAVYSIKDKTPMSFSFAVSETEVRGQFSKGRLDEDTLCGDVRLYDLTLTYSSSGTTTTLRGSRVPCEG